MTTTTTQHTMAPIIAVGPSGPGALAGHETVCYDCGLRIRASLLSIVQRDAWEHVEYTGKRAQCLGQPAHSPMVAECGNSRVHGLHSYDPTKAAKR